MNKHEIKILLFGPLPPPITGQSVAFKQVYDNLKCEKLVINTTQYLNNRLGNTIYSIFRIFYFFLFKNFDVVYFTCSRSKMGFIKDFFLVLASQLFRKKIVNHLHGSDFNNFIENTGFLRNLVLYTYKRIDASIVLLDTMKQDFSRFPKMKIFTVHNSYSKIFDSSVEVSKAPLTILYLSNIMATKGIMEFLASAKEVLSNNYQVKYVIAGSFFPDEKESKSSIKDMFYRELVKIQDIFGKNKINYVGTVSGIEKVKIFLKSSIFILPTYYKTEAFPITFVEAMRTGNAIISTRHKHIPKIITNKNGILVDKKSIDQLISAQELLIKNPSRLKLIQKYNVEYSKEKFSPQQYVSHIEKVFSHIYKH